MNSEELITLYKLYLHSLEEREENGDKYGDTEELIKIYEDRLEKAKIKVKRRVEYVDITNKKEMV